MLMIYTMFVGYDIKTCACLIIQCGVLIIIIGLKSLIHRVLNS